MKCDKKSNDFKTVLTTFKDNILEWVTSGLSGSGKGFDADKLDGKDGSEYALSTHNHDTRYLGKTATATDSDKLEGEPKSYFAKANGDASKKFKVADATNNDEAVSLWQLKQLGVTKGKTDDTNFSVSISGDGEQTFWSGTVIVPERATTVVFIAPIAVHRGSTSGGTSIKAVIDGTTKNNYLTDSGSQRDGTSGMITKDVSNMQGQSIDFDFRIINTNADITAIGAEKLIMFIEE